MPHDHDAHRPSAATAGTDRASRAHLSTGALLTNLGQRVGQPARPPGPARRRPLLPVQATTAEPALDPQEQEPSLAAVMALLKRIAAWDATAIERTRAVARYALAIARALAPAGELQHIRNAALLCNVGLMAVPNAVLAKVDALTPTEQQLIRRHAIHSAEILQEFAALRDEVVLVLHHHEDYDGGGYPYGVSGEWIPLGARIIRVAETYDALLQTRPYRSALTSADALATLQAGSGRLFDPQCVTALATNLRSPSL